MSGGELILYAYAAICVAMLLYNIAYALSQGVHDKTLTRRTNRLTRVLTDRIDRAGQGEEPDGRYLKRLGRKLSNVDWLMAYQRASEPLMREDDPASREYLRQTQPVLLKLAVKYAKREDVEAAYFAWFLSKCGLKQDMTVTAIREIMVSLTARKSLYCRVNAMQALYAFGAPEEIVQALELQERLGRPIHDKILTDGLLTFHGDHERLISLFWERFERLEDITKLPILNYIRFRSGSYGREMLAILTDPARDKELRLAAMRYCGKYVLPEARESLMSFAATADPEDWEYAAVAVTCLADYPGDDVTEVLLGGLRSSNWYVRFNSAAALQARGVDYGDIPDVMEGGDRYAREMIMYRLDKRRIQERQEVTV